ncbi:HIT domain-containing protein [Patescibacteria group bacterium]|nr:HIT domain-containing protein [Patescibacteria group bacterium]MBU1970604.1 HIT domain-containing protein [Patescibacteria group bacterium]
MTKVANPRVSDWYDRVVSSLDKCVFCDLKAKYILAEESGMVLTVNLFPYLDGHLLIIPRAHQEKFCELDSRQWAAVDHLTRLGMTLLKQTFGVEDCHLLYREGGVISGKSLGHLHFHLMPCVTGFVTRDQKGIYYNYRELKLTPLKLADRLRKTAAKMIIKEKRVKPVEFMRQACLLCDKSTCGYKTGCVLVKNGQILAEGWNATLPGEIYCQNGECIREKEHLTGGKDIDKVCSIHAEAYALAECARQGLSVAGADVYVTTFPCIICCRLLAKAGVAGVYYLSEYSGGRKWESILTENGIKVKRLPKGKVWPKAPQQ